MKEILKPKKLLSFKDVFSFFKDFFWFLKLAFPYARLEFVISFSRDTVRFLMFLLSSFLTAKIIDDLTNLSIVTFSWYDFFFLKYRLSWYLLSFFAINFTDAIINPWLEYYVFRLNKMLRPLYASIFNHMLDLDLQYHEDPKITGKLQSVRDHIFSFTFATKTVFGVISAFIKLVIASIILWKVFKWYVILFISFSVGLRLIGLIQSIEWWRFYNSNKDIIARSWVVFYQIQYVKDLLERKVLATYRFIYKKWLSLYDRLFYLENGVFKRGAIRASLMGGVGTMILDLFSWLLPFKMFVIGRSTLGDFLFYKSRFQDVRSASSNLAGVLQDITEFSYKLADLRYILSLKPLLVNGRKKIKRGSPISVEFRNVWFKYPTSSKYVLKNINFKIEAEDTIAIVGKNGAGKTTLIKLIARLYDVSKGEILINGINIKEYDINSLRKNISALFQDYDKLDFLSVKENVIFADPYNRHGSWQEALKQADAWDFVKHLPAKEGTLLDKRWRNGVNISGGQWQKIALARIFYRRSGLLILDEPTASIDAVAEAKIFKRVFKFIKKKTVILVSHRFSTIKKADKIFVLNNGKIVEIGTHEELMRLKGYYFEMYQVQAEKG